MESSGDKGTSLSQLDKDRDRKAIRALYASWDQSKSMKSFYLRLRGLRGTMNSGAQTRRTMMMKFFRDMGTDPDTWVEEIRQGKRSIDTDFNEYMSNRSNEGKGDEKTFSDLSLKNLRATFMSFARSLKLPEPDLEKIGSAQPKNDVKPFTKEEIINLVNCCRNPRDRALILLAFTSGLRISEIGHLKVANVKEILERKEEPYAVEVTKDIAKGKRAYISFCNQDAADALKTLIDSKGLKGEDFIFTSRLGSPLSKRDVDMIFFNLVERANFKGKRVFHQLRKYCRTHLSLFVSKDWTEKIIGHGARTLEQIYTTPEIEEMRREYAKALGEFAIYSKNGSTIKAVKDDMDELREKYKQQLEVNETFKEMLEFQKKRIDELLGMVRQKEVQEDIRKAEQYWKDEDAKKIRQRQNEESK